MIEILVQVIFYQVELVVKFTHNNFDPIIKFQEPFVKISIKSSSLI